MLHVIHSRGDVNFMKVREAIKAIEADGWYLAAVKGDHRQYKHLTKPGRVTVLLDILTTIWRP